MNPVTGRASPAFTASSPPGTLVRSLSAVEHAFASLLSNAAASLKKDPLAVSLVLRLSFPAFITNIVPHLRTAWAVARKLHPHLGSVLLFQARPGTDHRRSQQIKIPTFGAEEDWLCETFLVDAEAQSGNGVFESAGINSRYATCTWIPASSELFLHSSHWRCDGYSMLTIASDFLSVLARSMADGSELALDSYTATLGDGTVAPSLDWIADGFVDETSMPPYAKIAADGMIQQMLAGAPSVALPVAQGKGQATPGNPARAVVMFTPEETKQLLTRCKERKVTITVATHAALILCTARYPQHPMCKSYSSAFPVDLRSSLPEPYKKPPYSVGLLYCGLPLSVLDVVNDNKSFAQVCDELGLFYQRDRQDWCKDDRGEAVSVTRLAAPWTRRNLAALTAEVPPDTPNIRAIDFSSLGLIDRRLQRDYHAGEGGKVIVNDFWLSTQVVAKPVQCHSWTFRDEYRLQATWNQSYYEKPFMEKFLHETKQEMFRGLGMSC